MADVPAHPSRSNGPRPAILIGLGLIGLGLVGVLVVTVLSLHGPLDDTAQPPPHRARITRPSTEPGSARTPPSFDVVRVNPTGDTVIAGRAAPGAEVIIRQGGKEIGRTLADDRGEWVFLPSEPLASGARELTLTARIDGGPEITGAGSVLLVVPERLPPGSVPGMALPQNPVSVLSATAGAPRVLQGAAGQNPATATLGLDAVEYDNQGQLRFAGNAPPGARIRVLIDGQVAGEAVAGPRGGWTLIPSTPVTLGVHRLRLDRLGPDGQVAEFAEYPFQRDILTPKELAEGNIVVRPGHNLWLLARSRYGEGARYTVIYEANRARLKDPGKIYPGQILSLPPDATAPRARPNLAVGR